MARSSRTSFRKLSALAQEQGGYFIAKQAKEIGYDYPHLEYHLAAGNFERIGHGLYRLPIISPSEHDDLIRLALWSRDRNDVPQAVVSHESALVLHNLTELLPNRTHLTVPPKFRKLVPKGCVLHKDILTAKEIEERAGFRVTTPLRTLLDAASGGVSQEQLDKAVKEALARGLVRRNKLAQALRENPRIDRRRLAVNGREITAK
jgi:predicted transcriptional regulator of viral defense system